MKYLKLFENYNQRTGRDFMSDLYDVGTKKAVGYLPFNNIKLIGNDTAENVIEWCKLNNLKYKHYSTEEGNTGGGGAFYVYDYEMLKTMLEKYSDILEKTNIPTEPDAYIEYIENNNIWEHQYPEVYKIIGLTFNDKRFI